MTTHKLHPRPIQGALGLWVITENPSDFPGKFVLRQQWVLKGQIHHAAEANVCETLFQARAFLPAGLVNIGRNVGDDPVIVEVWI
jgi:hypothetical protein